MKKNASDASDDENLIPGTFTDRVDSKSEHIMRALIEVTTKAYPGTSVMVVVMDKDSERFNYASNVHRGDMRALLKALLKRFDTEGKQ